MFAATITVPDNDNHTYAAYQIFTGGVENGVLSNIHYGANAALPAGKAVGDPVDASVLSTIEGLASLTEAARADELAKYADLSGTAKYSSITKSSSTSVEEGYYLIKDTNIVDGEEQTLYIVQVIGDFSINRKAGTTTSDKNVDDINDSDTSVNADNVKGGKTSDYDIGDFVPYHLTGTITEKVDQYKTYHITFEDTLEDGKFDEISDLSIAWNDGTTIENTDDYTVKVTGVEQRSKNGFTVRFDFTPKEGKDLKSIAGKTIKIDFSAKLGVNASVGEAGNRNTLVVKYSNNPNSTEDGEGETTPTTVITFTYKVLVNKIDENDKPLPKAGFTLYKILSTTAWPTGDDAKDAAAMNAYFAKDANHIATWTDGAGDTKTSFTFNGLDDGIYVLCETTTPAGYNTMEPKSFKVTATHGGSGENELKLTALNGEKVNGEIDLISSLREGSLTATIKNNKGAVLPSTGGSGTTMIYIIGVILLAGAGILLVTRRRMKAE